MLENPNQQPGVPNQQPAANPQNKGGVPMLDPSGPANPPIQNSPGPGAQKSAMEALGEAALSQQSVGEANIHTMPNKFMGDSGTTSAPRQGTGSGGGSGKKLILIVGIVALVLAAITAGAYFFLNSSLNPFVPQPTSQVQTPPNVNTENTNTEPNVNTTVPDENSNGNTTSIDDSAARTRDEIRVSNIIDIAKALDAYYTDFGSYPQFLSLIPATILESPPVDPLTRGAYTYAASLNRQSYELVFDVEASASFKGEVLTQGTYKMSPEDFGDGPPQNVNTNIELPIDPVVDPTRTGNYDADGDGLTTFEEQLFRSSAQNDDTDSDGYGDGAEVKNFFSPTQSGGLTLDQAGLVKPYTNTKQGYQLYYPAEWVISVVDTNAADVILTSGTGEDFNFTVSENPENLTSWEWYVANISGDFNQANVDIVTIADREAVRTFDGRSAYVADGDKVFSLEYNLNGAPTVNYPTIFNFIVDYYTITR